MNVSQRARIRLDTKRSLSCFAGRATYRPGARLGVAPEAPAEAPVLLSPVEGVTVADEGDFAVMIWLMVSPSVWRADSIEAASRVQLVQSGPTERAISIATSSFPRFLRV